MKWKAVRHWPRVSGVGAAGRIARCLEMDFHFHPALHLAEERYGDAIPSADASGQGRWLLARPARQALEPGALWVAIDVQGTQIQLLNTHLGLLPRERLAQVEALLGSEWLAHPDCRGPAILCGDFNALPQSRVCRRLRNRLKDAQSELARRRPRGTFFGRFPAVRIDHLFVDAGFEVTGIEVPDSELARVASNHLPLIVEVRLDRPAHD